MTDITDITNIRANIRIAEFNSLKESGKMTVDVINQIVVESLMPLTINEIGALFREKTGRGISREYLRARLELLEAVNKVTSRPETPSEVALQLDARGGPARLFFTENTPQLTRTQLPNVPRAALRIVRRENRKKVQRRPQKTTSSSTTDSLARVLDALYADRTVELQARIKELEARLAQIVKLAK